MGGSKQLDLTPDMGNTILRGCFQVVFPDKLDKAVFSAQMRADISENIRQLKKAVGSREVSPIFKREKKFHFGPEDWYETVSRKPNPTAEEEEGELLGEVQKTRWQLKPEHKNSTVQVELSGKAKKGLASLLLLWAHPGPAYLQDKPIQFQSGQVGFTLSPGRQDEVVWPLAEQIGVVAWLEEKLELKKSNANELKISFDEDLEKEKELKEAVGEETSTEPQDRPILEKVK